jgi:hypothetical protein
MNLRICDQYGSLISIYVQFINLNNKFSIFTSFSVFVQRKYWAHNKAISISLCLDFKFYYTVEFLFLAKI